LLVRPPVLLNGYAGDNADPGPMYAKEKKSRSALPKTSHPEKAQKGFVQPPCTSNHKAVPGFDKLKTAVLAAW
jgi:hypothetical protein